MNLRVWWSFATVVALIPSAAATPAAFETPVLTDPADLAGQEGLDVVSLGQWTTYFYDAEDKLHLGFYLNLCVGFVNLPDAPAGARVHLFATINGKATEYWADVGFVGAKVVIAASNINATANQTSVIFGLPFDATALSVGSVVADVFVATSTEQPVVGRVYHDIMPVDNGNRPAVALTMPNSRGELTVNDSYPFFTLEPSGPLVAESILGLPAQFRVMVTPAPGLRSDVVRFFPNVTAGWNLTQNYEFLGPFGEQPMEMAFSLSRPNATIDDVGRATVKVISNSGAYEVLSLTANVVSGLTFASDRFELPDLSSTRAGQLRTIEIKVLDAAGSPKPGSTVQLEAHFHGGRVAMTNETTDANGTAHWPLRFDRAGTWTLRATLLDEKPTPFIEFHVEVASQPASPVAPLWTSLLLVAVVATLMRRR